MAEFVFQMIKARKSYGDRVILDDVTLSFLPGAKIGVVGPNGMGKSTLLKIMAGLARPTVGTVERFCEDGGLGYLGHATFIYPGLTALENLAFWSGMHGNLTVGTARLLNRILQQGCEMT